MANHSFLLDGDDDLLMAVADNIEWGNAFDNALDDLNDGIATSSIDLAEYYDCYGQVLAELNGENPTSSVVVIENPIQELTINDVLYGPGSNDIQNGGGWANVVESYQQSNSAEDNINYGEASQQGYGREIGDTASD